MPDVHEIRYRGRAVAAVVGEQVIIGQLAAEELAFVKAVCAYAVEVIDGTLPGPYSDHAAEQYAALALETTP